MVVEIPPDGKKTYVLDGTGSGCVVVDVGCNAVADIYDMFGGVVATEKFAKGLYRLSVPPSGYARIKADFQLVGKIVEIIATYILSIYHPINTLLRKKNCCIMSPTSKHNQQANIRRLSP